MDETHVVTVFLRNGSDVFLRKRSDEVGSYPGRWGAVSGHVTDDPDEAVYREINEATGLTSAVTLVRGGDAFPVDDPDHGRWVVHPYLFECDSRTVETNLETTTSEWVPPTEILRRETVPDLWTAYLRVGPTIQSVRADETHGSDYISVRALEVLRNRAAALVTGTADSPESEWAHLSGVARKLRAARPGMRVVENRINHTMNDAGDRTAEAVERAAAATIRRALEAKDRAAANAAKRLVDAEVLTLSRSGTVLATLCQANPATVLVAESRPDREGIDVAEDLSCQIQGEVVVFVDAAIAYVLATRQVDAVLVGADAVLADGRIVNKVGTCMAAVTAKREGVPIFVVATREKVSPDVEPSVESGDPSTVYDGDAPLTVLNPTFDVTPADLPEGVITETGLQTPRDIAKVAEEMAAMADWDE